MYDSIQNEMTDPNSPIAVVSFTGLSNGNHFTLHENHLKYYESPDIRLLKIMFVFVTEC